MKQENFCRIVVCSLKKPFREAEKKISVNLFFVRPRGNFLEGDLHFRKAYLNSLFESKAGHPRRRILSKKFKRGKKRRKKMKKMKKRRKKMKEKEKENEIKKEIRRFLLSCEKEKISKKIRGASDSKASRCIKRISQIEQELVALSG